MGVYADSAKQGFREVHSRMKKAVKAVERKVNKGIKPVNKKERKDSELLFCWKS